jgi:hypothetical protein
VLHLRCPVLLDDTNYYDWVPYMRRLHLWEFLTGELPCSPSPLPPVQPVISKKTTTTEKERLIADYDDHLASLVLVASMDDRFSADIVELERSHQMWHFLHSRYEPTGRSTFLVAIPQRELFHQGDDTVHAFFDQLSGVSVSMPTHLLSDSIRAISIARDPVKHELTKHIGIDAHFT